jgi:hypothetical protein
VRLAGGPAPCISIAVDVHSDVHTNVHIPGQRAGRQLEDRPQRCETGRSRPAQPRRPTCRAPRLDGSARFRGHNGSGRPIRAGLDAPHHFLGASSVTPEPARRLVGAAFALQCKCVYTNSTAEQRGLKPPQSAPLTALSREARRTARAAAQRSENSPTVSLTGCLRSLLLSSRSRLILSQAFT